MPADLTLYCDPKALLIPPGASKDARYRLGRFANWLSTNGLQWHQPDLARYRDAMLETYASSTASAHLSTIRALPGDPPRQRDQGRAVYDCDLTLC
jgi:hypothetical protein